MPCATGVHAVEVAPRMPYQAVLARICFYVPCMRIRYDESRSVVYTTAGTQRPNQEHHRQQIHTQHPAPHNTLHDHMKNAHEFVPQEPCIQLAASPLKHTHTSLSVIFSPLMTSSDCHKNVTNTHCVCLRRPRQDAMCACSKFPYLSDSMVPNV